MAFRGMPFRKSGYAGIFTLVSFLGACGNQAPSFQDVSATYNPEQLNESDLDALAKKGPESGTENGTESGTDGYNPDGSKKTNANHPEGSEGICPPETECNVSYEPVVMHLTQSGKDKVDILWVVDSSGSMSEEQAYLANNFTNFIQAMDQSSLDFQTAVTSTDICRESAPSDPTQIACPTAYNGSSATHLRGSFVGDSNHTVLHRDDSNLVSKFQSYTTVGTNGSGFEHGLKASHLAIEKVLAGDNEPLLRNNSFLAIIVVSDEEDDGIGLGMKDGYNHKNFVELGATQFRYTDTDLINYLDSVKGNGNFSISTITGTRDSNGNLCSSPHSSPIEEGTQYIAAATKTGGVVQSICDTTWDQSLYNLGYDLKAQITQIKLEKKALPSSINVSVNGVKNTNWEYIAGINAIKFQPGHVPIAGASIEVNYFGASN